VAEPVDAPKQPTLVGVVLTVTADGAVITAVAVPVHELASVAVTVYVPAAKDEIVAPVPPVLHA